MFNSSRFGWLAYSLFLSWGSQVEDHASGGRDRLFSKLITLAKSNVSVFKQLSMPCGLPAVVWQIRGNSRVRSSWVWIEEFVVVGSKKLPSVQDILNSTPRMEVPNYSDGTLGTGRAECVIVRQGYCMHGREYQEAWLWHTPFIARLMSAQYPTLSSDN